MNSRYSFDISYEVSNKTRDLSEQSVLNNIIKDYPSIRWYASDVGVTLDDCGKRIQAPVFQNSGYLTDDIGAIISVAGRIGNDPDLFVDFVSLDTNRIYKSSCAKMEKQQRDEYNKRVSALEGDEKKLYDLCSLAKNKTDNNNVNVDSKL